jgi:hypothetical protein
MQNLLMKLVNLYEETLYHWQAAYVLLDLKETEQLKSE